VYLSVPSNLMERPYHWICHLLMPPFLPFHTSYSLFITTYTMWVYNVTKGPTRQQYFVLCWSYHAFSYIQYISQQMNMIRYNKIQFMISINSYMFSTRVPSKGNLLKQRKSSPTCQFMYWFITTWIGMLDLCSLF
jgi:hypothetical protein